MVGRLEHRVAVITGAGSGIGLETSLLFAKEGCNVVCADINLETATRTADLINNVIGYGQKRAIPVQADVSKEPQVAAAVQLAVSHFGRLDVMCEPFA
jgi:NAD(P)-dependent dehydrogenase (short-subunit alcohol dehydrogenase family)